MLFNTGHKFLEILEPMSQEEILSCPEVFCMTLEATLAHPQCTAALRARLLAMPWSGAPTVLQVRPQDWRHGPLKVLGDGWHVDTGVVECIDGVRRCPPDLDDYRLLSVSFGDVTETEFVATPMEFPDARPPYDHGAYMGRLASMPFQTITAAPNQLVEYTSRDIHRMSPHVRLGRARLLFINLESTTVPAGGIMLPNILDRVR
jgi:hypothetical protein